MSAVIYNNLPPLEKINEMFVKCPKMFKLFGSIFIAYGNLLVHAHCILADGEKMISAGNVTEPAVAYPDKWLANG
ncbi:hypothetical protein M422DRAFT_177096 [Sphaerobolus stellatus SS14]|uniref:Uncharacterized protein n=1 Tax=Sphaerobolus stellatus (strain SS14) TaxID=990650 RepID=A0A0C9U5A2_SPHS4|nr:hypothetical protein M422DRAFT_177096 [Sphaerobolus stellatus SS14]